MAGNKPQLSSEEEQAAVLCEFCGSVMVLEDGKLICPHCDGEIDYFGEDDDDDTK